MNEEGKSGDVIVILDESNLNTQAQQNQPVNQQ